MSQSTEDIIDKLHDIVHHSFHRGFESGKEHEQPSEKTLEIILGMVKNNKDFYKNMIQSDKIKSDKLGHIRIGVWSIAFLLLMILGSMPPAI